MKYNVVFEYDETMGGSFGCRFWTSYQNETEFLSLNKKLDGITIVAKGITEKEALNLTSLTPEICRLMGAAEQIFFSNPEATQEYVDFVMSNALYAIAHDREHIAINNLDRYDATKYINAYMFLVNTEVTVKTNKMIVLLATCYNCFGQINMLY